MKGLIKIDILEKEGERNLRRRNLVRNLQDVSFQNLRNLSRNLMCYYKYVRSNRIEILRFQRTKSKSSFDFNVWACFGSFE